MQNKPGVSTEFIKLVKKNLCSKFSELEAINKVEEEDQSSIWSEIWYKPTCYDYLCEIFPDENNVFLKMILNSLKYQCTRKESFRMHSQSWCLAAFLWVFKRKCKKTYLKHFTKEYEEKVSTQLDLMNKMLTVMVTHERV